MKKLLFLFMLSAGVTHAQVPPVLSAQFDYTLDSLRTLINAKSLSAAVELPDSSVWAGATGISSLVPPVNVTVNDAYLIGSVTKTLTAACILQLSQQNVLNLDDSIYTWLDTIPYVDSSITIRQMLRHQSGLFDIVTDPAFQPAMIADPDSIWSDADLVNTFIAPPLFAPGTGWSYCNTNYILLGMIIESATGNPFYTEIRNRFIIPYGLNSFSAWPFDTLTNNVAHVWIDLNGNGVTEDAHNFFMGTPSLNASGGAAGCYFSTATDLTKWMHDYASGEVLDSATMAQALSTVVAPGFPSSSYGLGITTRSILNYLAIGHGGDFGYAASSWYFPARDISITVLTNDNDHNSWGLTPVVAALLKTYNQYLASTGIAQNTLQSINVYPNPFTSDLHIEYWAETSDGRVELHDMAGKIISSENYPLINGLNRLTLSDLHCSSGIYILKIFDGGVLRSVSRVAR